MWFSEPSFNNFLLTIILLTFNDLLEFIPLSHYRLTLPFQDFYVVPQLLDVIGQSLNKPSCLDGYVRRLPGSDLEFNHFFVDTLLELVDKLLINGYSVVLVFCKKRVRVVSLYRTRLMGLSLPLWRLDG